jgi:hypothetical protein
VTWGLHDSVEFERQGGPAVIVITEAFEAAAAARAAVLGQPDHPRVAIGHPLARFTREELDAMAASAAPRVAARLLGR